VCIARASNRAAEWEAGARWPMDGYSPPAKCFSYMVSRALKRALQDAGGGGMARAACKALETLPGRHRVCFKGALLLLSSRANTSSTRLQTAPRTPDTANAPASDRTNNHPRRWTASPSLPAPSGQPRAYPLHRLRALAAPTPSAPHHGRCPGRQWPPV
jgi:hypothetical protein